MSRLRLSHFVAVLAASSLLLGIAGTANAKLIGFNGTLSIGLAGQPPLVATGVGQATLNSSAGIGGHLTTLQILANTVSVTGAVVPLTDPDVSPLFSLRGTAALGTGILGPVSGSGPLTRNTLPVGGEIRFCILVHCPGLFRIPLGDIGGTRGVGVGGLFTLNTFGNQGVKFSIYGQPWTVKTAIVTGIPTANGGLSTTSAFGFAHGPASATSSTAGGGGVIQLVTAIRIVSTFQITALFTTLTIHLVPEPGMGLLLGTGVFALAAMGRKRARK